MGLCFERSTNEPDFRAGQFVEHTVTGRLGRVHSETEEGARFVRVLFHGDKRTLPCRAEELEAIYG